MTGRSILGGRVGCLALLLCKGEGASHQCEGNAHPEGLALGALGEQETDSGGGSTRNPGRRRRPWRGRRRRRRACRSRQEVRRRRRTSLPEWREGHRPGVSAVSVPVAVVQVRRECREGIPSGEKDPSPCRTNVRRIGLSPSVGKFRLSVGSTQTSGATTFRTFARSQSIFSLAPSKTLLLLGWLDPITTPKHERRKWGKRKAGCTLSIRSAS